jgi:hypothetical protein
MRTVGWSEPLSKVGTESAIIDSATNLKQQIGATPRPSHLLRFVHPTVHQEIGRPFGDRGANSLSGPMPLGVVDEPVALAGQVTIQRVQRGPQLLRRRNIACPGAHSRGSLRVIMVTTRYKHFLAPNNTWPWRSPS